MGACSPPGNASPSTERERLASCPSSPSLGLFVTLCRQDCESRWRHTSIDRYVHSDSAHACVHTSCSTFAASIHPEPMPVTAIRAHVTTVGHTYSCDQLVPKGRVLLTVIKPHVSHMYMYVLFVYKVKLKGSTM